MCKRDRFTQADLCNLCKRVAYRLLQRCELLLGGLDLLLQPPTLLLQCEELLSGLNQLLLILTNPLFLLLMLWLQWWDLWQTYPVVKVVSINSGDWSHVTEMDYRLILLVCFAGRQFSSFSVLKWMNLLWKENPARPTSWVSWLVCWRIWVSCSSREPFCWSSSSKASWTFWRWAWSCCSSSFSLATSSCKSYRHQEEMGK